LWGVTEEMGNTPASYENLFARIKKEGFSGVETPISMIEDKTAFRKALDSAGLTYIAMINTCTFTPDPISSKLEDHIQSFKRLVLEAKELNPILINSHSGRDSWNFETGKKFFKMALEFEKEQNILICHETHRGRILFNPWITRDMCQSFPELKLTADLSHFTVVAGRVFDITSGLDDDWVEILQIISQRTKHIHARVGYENGPQVPHPAAPEYQKALELHEIWWDSILETQAKLGTPLQTIEPEHGTNGYQHLLPFTKMPVGDLWEINNWVKDHELERMGKKYNW
jgi:sugar phosphate isomerase/epimerase